MKCSWCFFPDYLYLCQKTFPHQEIEKLSKSVKWAKVKAIALSLWILANCSELHFSENEVYKLSKLPKQSALLSFHWSFISDLRSERISCEVLRACLGHHCANVTFKKSQFGQGSHVGKRGWYNVKTSNLLGKRTSWIFWISGIYLIYPSWICKHRLTSCLFKSPSTSFHASGAPRSPRDLQKCFQVQHVYDFTKFHHETPWNDIQILAWGARPQHKCWDVSHEQVTGEFACSIVPCLQRISAKYGFILLQREVPVVATYHFCVSCIPSRL